MLWRNDITSEPASRKVLLKRGEFTDSSRHNEDGSVRTIPYKVYYPETDNEAKSEESLPVIIWSHGFGGSRDGASFLSRYVASHGYVIIHLTHTGTDSSLWEGKDGHPWDILRKTNVPRAVTMNRFRDIPFVIDQLAGWVKSGEELGNVMDLSALGMCGHSFGAASTQVTAGQMTLNEDQQRTYIKEPRIKAGILYSPTPVGALIDAPPEEIYGSIDIPLFHQTGTDDEAPIDGTGYENRLVIYEHTGHSEKYLLVKNDGDHMVYNGTRGKLGSNDNRERHEQLIKVTSLAFWDAQLKSNEAARNWLTQGAANTWLDGDARFEFEP